MKIFLFLILFIVNSIQWAYAGNSNPHAWSFEGKYLLSVSDTDMVASAYVDGMLGPREGSDMLSIIGLEGLPTEYKTVEVPASNSVAGPPAALAIDPKGRYAYIIETFSSRPSNGDNHTFNDLSPGSILTVYDLFDPLSPTLMYTKKIADRPDAIHVSHDGNWLAIAFYPSNTQLSEKPLGLYRLNKGNIEHEFFPEIPQWKTGDRLIYVEWHPSNNIIAMVNNTSAEVSFYHVDAKKQRLQSWGNTVSVGKSPFIGRFTEDGHHFLVNNLFWGPDVQGTWNEAPPGTIANIVLDVEADKRNPRHALYSQVMVGPSPEGFAVSPNGEWVVSLNMERSWLPYDDVRQSWYSSISLIQRDPVTGVMNLVHTTAYDGILPEAAVFDASSKHVAVTTFDFYDERSPGGAIDYFRIAEDPINPSNKKLVKMRWHTPVSRGPHSISLIR